MRRYRILANGLAIAICAAAIPTAYAFDKDQSKKDSQPNVRNDIRAKSGKNYKKSANATIRSTELLGKNIHNSEEQGVGEIADLVLDAERGTIRYAAVTYGGLLGVGNKMFAVPFSAFQIRPNPNDRDDQLVILDVTQQQLDGDEGFDEDHWPNFADRKFTDAVDTRYHANRRQDAPGIRNESAERSQHWNSAVFRASQMHGMNIQNPQGKDVGEIQDLVIDTNRGKVRYAAVTYGGVLGVGDKLFAVPYEAFQVRPNPEDNGAPALVLDVTPQQLEGAQGFDQKHWPNFADPQFMKDLDQRYKVIRKKGHKADRNRDADTEARSKAQTKS